ncbi:MAG: LUD domain-containing protein [Acidobacteriota bacterium]|nr:LUD domain-containing protein [Acidobacteriota bacterium]
MSAGRDIILGRVRKALGRGPLPPEKQLKLRSRLAHPKRNLVPQRGDLAGPELVGLFVTMARKADAEVERLSDWSQVPNAVRQYLDRNHLPLNINLAPEPLLQALDWDGFQVWRDLPRREDKVAVTGCFAAAAETGTLVVTSGPEHATSLNLLPDHHLVVLPASRIRGSYEDTWDMLRLAYPDAPPRTVLWITGPSRTGDIEQTLQLGAHGPLRLQILLIDDLDDA